MTVPTQRPGVSHYAYIFHGARLAFGRDWHHHELDQARPGARRCGICGRWVVRGMGRWWDRG